MKRQLKKTLEEELENLAKSSHANDTLTVEEILNTLAGKSNAILLIILALPFCLPIQIPGFSTPFGLLTVIIGLRMVFGRDLWLPSRLMSLTIPSKKLAAVSEKSLILIQKFRPYIRPRLQWVFQIPFLDTINGLLVVILGILLSLPLPVPFTNLVCAYSLLVIALGVLEDDGVFLILGYVFSFVAFSYFAFLYFSFNFFSEKI